MTNLPEIYYQTANRHYIENDYGKSQWVQITGEKDLNGAVAHFWCVLLDKDRIDLVFRDHSWDVMIGNGGPGFECCGENCEYRRTLIEEGFEHFVYYRDFYGVKKSFVELSQEFVLLNNLYFDEQKNTYYAMLEDGSADEAVRVQDENTFLIKLSYLTRYAAAKQMAVILFYDIRTHFDETTTDIGVTEFLEEKRNQSVFYKVWGGDLVMLHSHAFSVLMGKKIIYPRAVDTCGYWPYEKKQEFIDFIIGVDENGNEKTFTCNPDQLADYFGTNPDAPHYLTPVFFNREVLQRYLLHPDLYTIRDGRLECQALWSIEIDNHHKDSISVYLRDLGQYLPESERLYWKSYNIVSDEGVSPTAYQRDFLNAWAESDMSDHMFKKQFIETNDAWNQTFGWPLFLPLSAADQYNFDLLRIPLSEGQNEFDSLVLSLVKVLIDSLNVKMIQKTIPKQENQKSISKLESWIKTAKHTGYEKHVDFLRNLQELRSAGTGHRKGSNYDKIASLFGVGEKSLRDVFDDILKTADSFLLYMYEIAQKSSS